MCGLCGILDFEGRPIDVSTSQRMLASLRERGPDDEGSAWLKNGVSVFLGHRRLSIIDLSEAGRQPLFNEDGTVAVLLNGEIYNFAALRSELIAKGHQFRSRTDTEVIAHVYEESGPGGIARLDGMFALAVWDQRNRQLILARDRPGKKPLYYAHFGSTMVFASQIRTILEHPGIHVDLNPRAVPLYLGLGYVPCPETFYDGIFQVPAGTYLVVGPEGVRGPVPYWDLTFPHAGEERRIGEAEAGAAVRRLLAAAVERRLVADVPLGAFLSGGIDSSIVVGLMTRLMDRPVKTFTIGFDGAGAYDERRYARCVAQHFRTEHTEFVVRPDAVSLVGELVAHHEQPFGDSSGIPTYLVSKLTRQHVTVALSGDGGDELFAGYERFFLACLAEAVPQPMAAAGQWFGGVLPGSAGHGSLGDRAARFFRQAAQPLGLRYRAWNTFLDEERRARLLSPALPALDSNEIFASFDACFGRTEGCHPLNRLLDLNFRTYLHDHLLVKMDRMSMAHGLEARSPFLDTALVEFVATLPPHLKLRGWRSKYILKRAFSDLLPPFIRRRRKHGFGIPLGTWFARELRDYVYDALLAPDAEIRTLLNQSRIGELYDEHLSGRRDLGPQLWLLLTLEVWLRQRRVRWRSTNPDALLQVPVA